MGKCYIHGAGGGADLDFITAGPADIIAGKTSLDKDGEPVHGTIPILGAISHSLPINGSYTIPYGFHSGGGKITQSIPTQGAITLNPGTTAKTGTVSGKYMTGNVSVPAINIPPAYIKKGQKITFPDGSSVTGTFEGWVPVATDLYYKGNNINGFTSTNSNKISFQNTSILFNHPGESMQTTAYLRGGRVINFTPYNYINVTINVTYYGEGGYVLMFASSKADDSYGYANGSVKMQSSGTFKIAISNLDINGYVHFYTYANRNAGIIATVDRIWLS